MEKGFFVTNRDLYIYGNSKQKDKKKNKYGLNLQQMRNICLIGSKENGKYYRPKSAKLIRSKWHLMAADFEEFLNDPIGKGVCK